jgi:hypothetical protein
MRFDEVSAVYAKIGSYYRHKTANQEFTQLDLKQVENRIASGEV